MHQKTLSGVTDTDTLCFGIGDDLERHGDISALIDENMAVAGTCFDDRDRAVLNDTLDQSGAAARDQHVDILIGTHHLFDSVTAGVLDEQDHIGVDVHLFQCIPHDMDHRDIGVDTIGTAAQERDIA